MIDDLVALEAAEEDHPADDEFDTGAFSAMTDDFIERVASTPPPPAPLATFEASPELASLNATQDEARAHLKNILLLTQPPKPNE